MLHRDRAVVLVVDIQDKLMPKSAATAEAFLEGVLKLIQSARIMGLPILVTEQNPEKIGPTNARTAEALGDAPRFAKMAFGCFADPAVAKAVAATGRKQILVLGMETHICVKQTVLGAIEEGYEVFVPRDATAAMHEADHHAGIERMARAGAEIVTAQMAIFELIREAGTPLFRRMLPLLK